MLYNCKRGKGQTYAICTLTISICAHTYNEVNYILYLQDLSILNYQNYRNFQNN